MDVTIGSSFGTGLGAQGYGRAPQYAQQYIQPGGQGADEDVPGFGSTGSTGYDRAERQVRSEGPEYRDGGRPRGTNGRTDDAGRTGRTGSAERGQEQDRARTMGAGGTGTSRTGRPDRTNRPDGAAADGEARKAEGENGGGDSLELSPEAKKMVEELKARDKQVRAHEAAHLAAGAGITKGGASYTMQRGPDGNSYAIGGEVPIDAGGVPGDPRATLAKAQQIAAAALAPADPSPQDRAVAAQARQMAAQASMEMARSEAGGAEETGGPEETEGNEGTREADGAIDAEGTDRAIEANAGSQAAAAGRTEAAAAADRQADAGSAADRLNGLNGGRDAAAGRAEATRATGAAGRPDGADTDAGSAADRLNGLNGTNAGGAGQRVETAQDRQAGRTDRAAQDDGRGAPTMTTRGRQAAETYAVIERITLAASGAPGPHLATGAYQAVA
jgi:hypothetical protein